MDFLMIHETKGGQLLSGAAFTAGKVIPEV